MAIVIFVFRELLSHVTPPWLVSLAEVVAAMHQYLQNVQITERTWEMLTAVIS